MVKIHRALYTRRVEEVAPGFGARGGRCWRAGGTKADLNVVVHRHQAGVACDGNAGKMVQAGASCVLVDVKLTGKARDGFRCVTLFSRLRMVDVV